MLLRNATTVLLSPLRVCPLDVRIDGGVVAAAARGLAARRGEQVRDLRGRIILPGLVNAHTHLYSSLARGMPAPTRSPRDFPGILRQVWWRLDRALDEETIHASALAGAAEAVLLGTTTLIDHHASPNAIPGSLDLIREALGEVGIRGVLCYETTDRGGMRRRDAGLEENDRFAGLVHGDPMARGMIGAHASFTLSDATLALLAEVERARRCGFHVHAAEDRSDGRRTGGSVIRRFRRHGLLTPRTILAHGVHLAPAECAEVRRSGSWIVHNPRSNMNNAVGYAPIGRFGRRSALGTDGFPSDMFTEASLGFHRNREAGPAAAPFDRLPAMLAGSQRLAAQIFDRPFGTFDTGAPADLVVLGYDPPTPLHTGNIVGHLLFGMHARMVRDVMVDGRWIVRDGRLTTVDEERLARRTRRAAARLWRAMEGLRP